MNAVYDHMIAIIFIGIMFVWAVAVVPQLSYNNIEAVNQQQLRNMELNVFNAILMDTGSNATDTNWGTTQPFDQNSVKRFGLANSGKELYTLDPDKVQRLVGNNPLGNITYKHVKELLGLDEYDFMFQILPPFNVTMYNGTQIDEDHSPINKDLLNNQGILSYELKVAYLDGRPIHNATIVSTVMYTVQSFTPPLRLFTLTSATDEMGLNTQTANLNVSGTELGTVMIIAKVSVADVHTIVVSFGKGNNGIVDINMVGDQVMLTEPKDPSNGAIRLHNIYCYYGDGSIGVIYPDGNDLINTGINSPFMLWNRNFEGLKDMDPVMVILDISAIDNTGSGKGRREMTVAGPYHESFGYSIFEFGSPFVGLSTTVKTQRSVFISGMTYTAQLILWKNSK